MNIIKHPLGEQYTSNRAVNDEYHCLHNGVQWVVRSPFGIHEAAYGDDKKAAEIEAARSNRKLREFKRNQQRNLRQIISNRIGV